MANEEHVRRLRRGAKLWNEWALATTEDIDLSGTDFSCANLFRASFANANLKRMNFNQANLGGSDFANVDLHETKFRRTDLKDADIFYSNLPKIDLLDASLQMTVFRRVNLKGANFSGVFLLNTVFADVDLSDAVGLDECIHGGPCTVDHRTLQKSGRLPRAFLRGVGMPDTLIEYLPSAISEAIQHYSCFISYSTRDQDFADRLYADLQNKAVRCWFAPHDMPIGGKIWDEIDSAIRLRDKVLLILSEHAIKSDWVEDEVTKALEEERKHNKIVLFPIRLDDAVMDTDEAWAAKLRNRHIGDFRRWKEHDEYQKSFARVVRDLTVKKGGAAGSV
jgi:TIR domain-containing protein/pentapeptide repeat protein